MIQDVDQSLRDLILGELKNIEGSLIKKETQVTFSLPNAVEQKGKDPIVNFYLHDVRENLQLRDESIQLIRQPNDNTIGKQQAPIKLDLGYMVTVHADGDPAVEHRVLSDVIAVLIRNKLTPERYLAESIKPFGPGGMMLQIAQPDNPAYANPSGLWSALGGQIKPMLGLMVTATFNPYEPRLVKRVREFILGFGQGVPPHGPQRPLDIRTLRVSAAGLVTEAGSDKPMSGVLVSVANRDEKFMTDERGFFHFENLPTGKHTLTFWKKGFKTKEAVVSTPPPGRSDLLEPVGVELESLDAPARAAEEKALAEAAMSAPGLFEMGRTVTVSLSGQLRYADGRPAAYLPIRVGEKRSVTDGEGMYVFTNLPEGEHKLVIEVPGMGEVEVGTKNGAALLPAKAGK